MAEESVNPSDEEIVTERLPDEPEPEPEPEKAEEEAKSEPEKGDGEEVEEEEPKPKRRRPSKTERELHRLRQEVEALRAAPQPPVEVKPETPPRQDEYASYEDFLVAKAKHELRQEQKAEEAKRAAERQKQDAERSAIERKAKADELREAGTDKYTDFEEVFSDDLPVSPAMAAAIVESEVGVDVAYWLGKHPSEARRIAGLSPIAAAKEVGKIEARLSAAPKPTSAPPPPRTLKSSAPVDKDPSKMSYPEYAAWRRKGS